MVVPLKKNSTQSMIHSLIDFTYVLFVLNWRYCSRSLVLKSDGNILTKFSGFLFTTLVLLQGMKINKNRYVEASFKVRRRVIGLILKDNYQFIVMGIDFGKLSIDSVTKSVTESIY